MTINAPDPTGMYCLSCGYDLAGLESPTCPECGRVFDSSNSATFLQRRCPPSIPLRWMVGIVGALAIALPSWSMIDKGTPLPGILILGVLPGLVALPTTIGGLAVRTRSTPRLALVAAFAPSTLFLLSFTSLAIHMHAALGGWPQQIGTRGFPGALVEHANVAQLLFVLLSLATWMILPAAMFFFAASLSTTPLRPWLHEAVFPFALCALVNIASLGAMNFAPEAFLYWWWD